MWLLPLGKEKVAAGQRTGSVKANALLVRAEALMSSLALLFLHLKFTWKEGCSLSDLRAMDVCISTVPKHA